MTRLIYLHSMNIFDLVGESFPISVPLEADLVKVAHLKKTYACYSAKHFLNLIHKRAHLSLINLCI